MRKKDQYTPSHVPRKFWASRMFGRPYSLCPDLFLPDIFCAPVEKVSGSVYVYVYVCIHEWMTPLSQNTLMSVTRILLATPGRQNNRYCSMHANTTRNNSIWKWLIFAHIWQLASFINHFLPSLSKLPFALDVDTSHNMGHSTIWQIGTLV